MSSSPSSSSSSDLALAPPSDVVLEGLEQFASILDLKLPVGVVLGTGKISVRECLSLAPRSVVRLNQAAGEDLQVIAGEIAIAKAEVVIVEDSTAVRLTEILKTAPQEVR